MDKLFDELLYIIFYNTEDTTVPVLTRVSKKFSTIAKSCMTDKVVDYFGTLPKGKLARLFIERHYVGVPRVYDVKHKRQLSLGNLSFERNIRKIRAEEDNKVYFLTLDNEGCMYTKAQGVRVLYNGVKDFTNCGIFLMADGTLRHLEYKVESLRLEDCRELIFCIYDIAVTGQITDLLLTPEHMLIFIELLYVTNDGRLIRYVSNESLHKTICEGVIPGSCYYNVTAYCATTEGAVVVEYHSKIAHTYLFTAKKHFDIPNLGRACLTSSIDDIDAYLVFSTSLVKDILRYKNHCIVILYHDGRLVLRDISSRKDIEIDTHVISVDSRNTTYRYISYIREP